MTHFVVSFYARASVRQTVRLLTDKYTPEQVVQGL